MKKRFLSALLVLGMVLTLLPTWALAATPDTPLPAPLNDARAGMAAKYLYDEGSYSVTTQTGEDGVVTVTIKATGLKPHYGASPSEGLGYWVGFALAAPEGAEQVQYAFSAEQSEVGEDNLSSPSALEPAVTSDGDDGIAFYSDPGDSDPKTWARVRWLDGEGAAIGEDTVYHMDMSVVVPRSIWPVEPAILHDAARQDPIPDDELYESYSVSPARFTKGRVPVTISAEGLVSHINANGQEGCWVGFAIVAPEGSVGGPKVAVGPDKQTAYDDANLSSTPLESNVTEEGDSGIAFYFDASAQQPNTWVRVQWMDEEGLVMDDVVYEAILSDVALPQSPVTVTPSLEDGTVTAAIEGSDLSQPGEGVTVAQDGITFDLSVDGDVSTAEIVLSAEALTSLEDSGKRIVFRSNPDSLGSLGFDAQAVASLQECALAQDPEFSELRLIWSLDGDTLELLAVASDEAVFTAEQQPQGVVTVTLPWPEPEGGLTPVVYYLNPEKRLDESSSYGYDKLDSSWADGTLSFDVGHFSTYRILNGGLPTLAFAGFEDNGATANQVISELWEELARPFAGDASLSITDCDNQTMYVGIRGTGAPFAYTLWILPPEDASLNRFEVKPPENTVTNASLVYFTFNREDHVGTPGSSDGYLPLAAGDYVIALCDSSGGSIDLRTLTLFSKQEALDDFDAFAAPFVQGPLDQLNYGEKVDEARAAIEAAGEGLDWSTDDLWSETLAAQKEALLRSLKEAVKAMLDQPDEGKVLPQSAYEKAVSALEAAQTPKAVAAILTEALNAMYEADAVALSTVGFKMNADDANAAIEALLTGGLALPEGVAFEGDCSDMTMYAALTKRTGDNAFVLRVTDAEGTVVYQEGIAAGDNSGVIYFDFDPGAGASNATEELAPGTYTFSLYPVVGEVLSETPVNSLSLTVTRLTFDANGGTPDPEDIFAAQGDTAELPSVTLTGKRLSGWETAEGELFSKTIDIANGAPRELALTARWRNASSGGGPAPSSPSDTTYAITVKQAENGSVSSSRERASEDDTVTLTVSAAQGYRLDELTVTNNSTGKQLSLGAQGGGKYTFKMPASSVTVEASFAEGVELPFTDVDEAAWYFDAVRYVFENGLLQGTSDTLFSPDLTTTRAMIVTVLWRMAEEPVINYAMTFDDVPEGLWYSEAVRWAAGEGIVTGYDDTRFGPNDAVTREQLAAMLYRYAVSQGRDVSVGEDTNILSYADAFSVSEYAVSALQWACGEGIVTGRDDGTLSPQDSALRSEFSAMLMRFCGVQQG